MRRLAAGPATIAEAAAAILRGAVVAIPTDTVYGLAVDPFDEVAVRRLFAVKGRPDDRAVPLIAADVEQIVHMVGSISEDVRRLADRFWPGPLTLLVAAPPALAAVTAGTGRVGVRVPNHQTARALCAACARPLTATSANLSGAPPSADADDVAMSLGDRVELLVDAGPTPGGPPSTIVDLSGDRWRLVRAGPVAWDEIRACERRG